MQRKFVMINFLTHLSKKPNHHGACTRQKESSKNFHNTPKTQSKRIVRRPVRPQIVVVATASGHIWWTRGPRSLCGGIGGTCNVTSKGGSSTGDVYKRDPLPSQRAIVHRERELQRTLAKSRHSIFGFGVWVGDVLRHSDGNDVLCTRKHFQSYIIKYKVNCKRTLKAALRRG